MYFPFLRGKQFELEALLDLSTHVYLNTMPIIEPVNIPTKRQFYNKISRQNIPFILITNPFHPHSNRLSVADVQGLINSQLSLHTSLLLGFIIDERFQVSELAAFLLANPTLEKVLIFRDNPLRTDLPLIQSAITSHTIRFLIFDDAKTNNATRRTFNSHPNHVLLIDGFQRQDRNMDYPALSTFDSVFNTWQTDGLAGLGDYATIGDHFQDGGGPVRVVSLHITAQTSTGLEVNHFSSTINSTIAGLPAQKIREANQLLVTSPKISPMVSKGLEVFRNLHRTGHNPPLGVLKKASIMHHIELMSSII